MAKSNLMVGIAEVRLHNPILPLPPTPRHTSHSGIFWKFGMKKNSKNFDFWVKKSKIWYFLGKNNSTILQKG